MVEAIVEHDYVAQEIDELTIRKGDIITNIIKKQTGWCEGSLNDKRGLFPNNFVKMIDKDDIMRKRKDRIRTCKVIFSYKQDHEDELSLNVGDIIEIVGEEEEGWWRGLLNGKEGVFPSNFVQEVNQQDNDEFPALPPKPAKTYCEVKYNYKAQNDDELSLKEGDVVTLISKDGQDAGWWRGELHGRVGVFPDNFVVQLDEEPKPASSTVVKQTAQQRKSQTDDSKLPINKKPIVPIKKSPSNTSPSGLLSGLKKKIADAVDGSSSSKSYKVNEKLNEKVNVFDQVERNAMLQDVRATRAKAPGRRPRSVIAKDGEAPIINGNSDYGSLEENLSSSNTSIELENTEKPKVMEWKKQKAPWLEEMKLNQAKRTSLSPGPEYSNTTILPSEEPEPTTKTPTKSIRPSTIQQPTPTPTSSSDSDNKLIRPTKPAVSTRPQSLENVKPPIAIKVKTPTDKATHDDNSNKMVTLEQYQELGERLRILERQLREQNDLFGAALNELKAKIEVETDLRMLLQAELEKLSQCVMQV